MQQESVFDISPWSLDKLGIEDLLPSMQALDISPSIERLRNFLPVLSSIGLDSISQDPVLISSPVALYLGGISILVGGLILCCTSLVQVRI